MARPTIPAAVLADRGVPLSLATGQGVTLCYTFRGLMRLEEEFGSLKAALEVLEQIEDGKAFTEITRLLTLGLLHEVEPHDPTNGQNGRSLGDVEVLVDYLDTGDLDHYSEAIGEAFSKAFPQTDDGTDEPDPTTATTASPGVSGTTSPASASGSPTTSSGA